MVIFKYTLEVADLQGLYMPKGAKLLTVQNQHGRPQLWALVDLREMRVPRRIAIYGTGNEIPDYPGVYVATFQQINGSLVWHVFDKGEVEGRF